MNRINACVFCVGVALWAMSPVVAQSPGRPPIAKQGFLRAIGIGGLSEAELISFVTDRGVAFELTAEERAIVLKAGHTQKLFDALTASYRGPKPKPLAPPAGPPASQEELLGWLRDGCDEESIERAIDKRGVSFPVTAELLGEVEKRGARKSLVDWLQARRLEAAKAALLTPAEPSPTREPEATRPTPRPLAPPPAPVVMASIAPSPAPVVPAPVVQPAPSANTPKTVAPKAAEQKKAEPVAEANEDAELYVMRRVKPVYPAEAKRGLSGAVRLRVLVNADGRVEEVSPLEGHPILVAAAEQAVRRWIYEPPTHNGKPGQAETVVKITFKAP